MLYEYEACSRCHRQRVVGYYDGVVYCMIRSTCECFNTLGRRFRDPGPLGRARRWAKNHAFLEIRSATHSR